MNCQSARYIAYLRGVNIALHCIEVCLVKAKSSQMVTVLIRYRMVHKGGRVCFEACSTI